MFSVTIHEVHGRKHDYTGLQYNCSDLEQAHKNAQRGLDFAAQYYETSRASFVALVLDRHGLTVEEIRG